MIDLLHESLAWPVRVGVNPLFFNLTGYSESYLWLCRLTFVIGMLLRERTLLSLLLGVTISCLLLDPLLMLLLHLLPLSLYLFERGKSSILISALAVALWVCASAPISAVGLLLFLALSRDKQQVGITLFVGGLLTVLFTDSYRFESYPAEARLSPITKMHSWSAPVISPELTARTLDYQVYERILGEFQLAHFAGAIILLVLLFLYAKKGRAFPRLFLSASVVAVSLLLLPPSLYWQFSGLFYGGSLLPLPWIMAIFILVAVALIERDRIIPLATLILVSCFLHHPRYVQASESFFSNKVKSYYPELDWEEPVKSFRPKQVVLRSSQPQGRRYALDGSISSRWTTGAPQRGGEWVELKFPKPIYCPYLRLSPGKFSADYPRGFRVDIDGEKRFSIASWQGPVKFVREGLAYFGSQSDVYFPLGEKPLSSVRVTQIGTDSYYYWSIARITCLKGRDGTD